MIRACSDKVELANEGIKCCEGFVVACGAPLLMMIKNATVCFKVLLPAQHTNAAK